MLERIIPMMDYASAFSNWLNLYLNLFGKSSELAITGKDALLFGQKINQEYHPDLVLVGSMKKSALPFLKDRYSEDKTQFFLCQNKDCQLPTTDFETIKTNLTNS